MRAPVTCAPDRFGDVVLARKDAPASYLFVRHTRRDAVQGVTLVTRGEAPGKPATDLHRLLQDGNGLARAAVTMRIIGW